MKTVFLFLILLIAPVAMVAQEPAKDLSFGGGTLTYDYYEGNQKISFEAFMTKLKAQDEKIANSFKSGRNLTITGTVIGSIGGFCFGYDLGTRLAGSKGNNALLIGGGSVMIGGTILYYVGERKMKKALTLYKNNSVSININPTETGLGICLNF
jgi:hypothetical protein